MLFQYLALYLEHRIYKQHGGFTGVYTLLFNMFASHLLNWLMLIHGWWLGGDWRGGGSHLLYVKRGLLLIWNQTGGDGIENKGIVIAETVANK